MSTHVDGAPPRSPDPDDEGSGGLRRRRAEGAEDSQALWVQAEMRRRIDSGATRRGRHSRDEADTQRFGVDELRARVAADRPPAPRPGAPGPRGGGYAPEPQHPGEPPPARYRAAPGYPDHPGPVAYRSGPDHPGGPAAARPPVAAPEPTLDAWRTASWSTAPRAYTPGIATAEPYAGPGPAGAPVPLPGADHEGDVDGEPTGRGQDGRAFTEYEDYEDEETPDRGDGGEVEQFERWLGPASVPLRMPPPQAYPDPATRADGPGGMRGNGAPRPPLERAGRQANSPDSLGGLPTNTPRGPAGPGSWSVPPAGHDPEQTDVGLLPPVPGTPYGMGDGSVGTVPEGAEHHGTGLRAAVAPGTMATRAPGTDPGPPAGAAALGPPVGARFQIPAEEHPDAPKRVRVVLSERKGVARTVRTVVDVQEGTVVGEMLRKNLIGGQLVVALRVGGIALLVLGLLPALFAFYPELGRIEVLGLRLPWLVLGVLAYPFLLGLGWWHTRAAEKVEQNFADHVQD